jgi:hypothetical protein
MKIYVTHSSNFDYQRELYEPLRNSQLNREHEITLPHQSTTEQFNSKKYMKECDLIIAEVSYPSTGQGIELGWADIYNVPIVCLYKKGTRPPGSLKVISHTFIEYENSEDMIKKISDYLKISFRN